MQPGSEQIWRFAAIDTASRENQAPLTFSQRAAAANREVAQRRQFEAAAACERRRDAVRHARVWSALRGTGASGHRATDSGAYVECKLLNAFVAAQADSSSSTPDRHGEGPGINARCERLRSGTPGSVRQPQPSAQRAELGPSLPVGLSHAAQLPLALNAVSGEARVPYRTAAAANCQWRSEVCADFDLVFRVNRDSVRSLTNL